MSTSSQFSICLTRWCESPLLVADRSTGKTRFSMLETIRQYAEEKLVEHGEAVEASSAHARYFADRETDIIALWDSPRQREAYVWFATELANLRTAFRWAADRGDLDTAASIATYCWLIGFCVENLEPVSWAEELDRACERNRAPALGESVCRRIAVLDGGPGRPSARVCRERSDALGEQPICSAVRDGRRAWRTVHGDRPT